jgi:hypothetical protein
MTSSYFDWLGTPHAGLVSILQNNFETVFLKENLRMSADQTHIVDQEGEILYRHTFSKIAGTNLTKPEAVDQEYDQKRPKMEYLIRKWRTLIETELILFVRQDTPTVSQTFELYESLVSQAPRYPFHVLYVVPAEYSLAIDHPNIHVRRGIDLPTGPTDWMGEDAAWDAIFSEFAIRVKSAIKP